MKCQHEVEICGIPLCHTTGGAVVSDNNIKDPLPTMPLSRQIPPNDRTTLKVFVCGHKHANKQN